MLHIPMNARFKGTKCYMIFISRVKTDLQKLRHLLRVAIPKSNVTFENLSLNESIIQTLTRFELNLAIWDLL